MKLVISLAFKNEIYSIAYDFPLYKLYRIRVLPFIVTNSH